MERRTPTKEERERIERLGDRAYIRLRDQILDEYDSLELDDLNDPQKIKILGGLFLEVLIDIRNNLYKLTDQDKDKYYY